MEVTTARTNLHAEVRELRGVLHDLVNGLSTMALLLDAARAGSVSTFGLLELIEQETTRLLAVARSGIAAPEPEPVEVRAVLELIALVAGRAGPAGVRLLPGREVEVLVDRAVLSRVLANLVDNAVRAAGPCGCVELSLSGAEEVVIDVVDDGPGFPLGPAGTAGRGLDLVNRLLVACGGRLELAGVAPRGTRARVVLPRHDRDRLRPARR
jgi:signal transduction histidine kinase